MSKSGPGSSWRRVPSIRKCRMGSSVSCSQAGRRVAYQAASNSPDREMRLWRALILSSGAVVFMRNVCHGRQAGATWMLSVKTEKLRFFLADILEGLVFYSCSKSVPVLMHNKISAPSKAIIMILTLYQFYEIGAIFKFNNQNCVQRKRRDGQSCLSE